MKIRNRLFLILLLGPAFSVISSVVLAADADVSPSLLDQYDELQDELANNVFGSPIVLRSKTSQEHAEGQVYAVLNTPFEEVKTILSQPEHWCDLAILHINIKACTYHKRQQDKEGEEEKQKVTFYIGRLYYQPPDQAFPLEYIFEPKDKTESHLFIQLTSADGPFGTYGYLITLEAIPIDAQHSFIRFQYRYHFGVLARMAMSTYLATFGRHKVGFTLEDGINIQGEPAHVKGMQGVVERNTIRYIYAIQATLDAQKSPPDKRQQQRFNLWYELISRHPRQLVEFTHEEYLERKKQELENQIALQKKLNK